MAFMSGNLCYQIEHHLFPDLPSNRYAEIGERVRALCDKYDLPYTTGSLGRQYLQSFWTIAKLALPDKLLKATSDDAPETHSELKFRIPHQGRDAGELRSRPRHRQTTRPADRDTRTRDRGDRHRLTGAADHEPRPPASRHGGRGTRLTAGLEMRSPCS